MEIAFHCPNCLADLIFDESKKYTCCFCHTTLTGKDEVHELEGGYYVGDAWNESLYHRYKCEDCDGEFVIKTSAAKQGCPLCSSTSLKDQGPEIGAMPKRAIPFAHTKQQAEEIFLDYIRNNSAVGRTLATDENKALLHKAYVPCWLFTYEVIAYAKLTVTLRNKANDNKTIVGIKGSEQLMEMLSPIRSSISRFQANRKGGKDASNQPAEHVTGGVLSWQGIPFDATGILQDNLMNGIQPYDQSKLITINEKVLGDTPVLAILKDPITCMQEFMDRVKKWTRQMIMDAHSDSYEILHFSDKTDYPLGIGELVLFPIWYMKGDYSGREYFFAMNGQTGEIDANIPMSKVSRKNSTLPYQSFWDKSRCTALNDTHFEFNIHDPNIEILDYSFFEKPRDSRITAEGRKKQEKSVSAMDTEIPLSKDGEEVAKKPEASLDASKVKKPSVPLDVQVVTDLKSLPKKLSKEEEAKREKEKAARLRAAARDGAKKPMEAAAEAPSWAKATTPPPSASNAGARPVRKKKAMDRPSMASSGNKPIWERPDDNSSDLRKTVKKPSSLAEQVARAQMGDVEPEQPSNLGGYDETPARGGAMSGQKPIWSREPEDELDDLRAPLPGPELMSLSSFLDKRAKEDKERGVDSQRGEPAREVQVRSFEERRSEGSLVESDDEVLAQARREAEEYEAAIRAAQERAAEAVEEEQDMFPEIEEYPKPSEEVFKSASPFAREPEIPEEIQSPFAVRAPEPESDLPELQEYTEGSEDMVANITFSFNKKNAAAEREHNRMSGSSIPRKPESKPDQAQGMSIMNSEYDSGVLPGGKRESDVVEYAPIAREERIPEVSENYFGSDENDRPLAYRPASPLAQARDVQYVEEVEPHPELDVTNRPLASRPAAPLAKVTDVTPSLDYINEHGVVEGLDNDVHQIPSLVSGSGRWGEMPEATETPSWAKPQGGFQETRESRFGAPRERTRRPSRDEMMRPRNENMRSSREEQEDREEDDRSSVFRRPGLAEERPASRPSAQRPSARSAEPKPEKQVPIWERVPDSDRPMPAWGASMAYTDERPAGSLTKPKDQIIDVEKPRTSQGVGGLSRNLGQAKEILPNGESREYFAGSRGSEVNNGLGGSSYPEQRSLSPRREELPQVEVEMPQSRRPLRPGAATERPQPRQPVRPRSEIERPQPRQPMRPRMDDTERPQPRQSLRPGAEIERPQPRQPMRPRMDDTERPQPRQSLRPGAEIERPQPRQPMRPRMDDTERPQPRQSLGSRSEEDVPQYRRTLQPRAERTMPGFSRRNDEESGGLSERLNDNSGSSASFSSERPRTFAQQRQMEEEEERLRELRSVFKPVEESVQDSPFRPGSYREEPQDDRSRAPYESSQFEDKPSMVAALDMLPDPVDDYEARERQRQDEIPSLARGRDVFHQDLAAEQENAMRAMRGLPEFDPDGPSPFKRN